MALWILSTPIGTLSDLSDRAKHTLKTADVIAAEDTRVTRKLLAAVGVAAPEIVALHAHNEEGKAEAWAERAAEQQVVLVSDAGTPGVSDPGRFVVAACLRHGVEIRTVPGPSALASALAASGFPAAPSTFIGFAPRKGLAGFAAEMATRPETLVIFEAPSRVERLVSALAAVAPHREAAVCREISKRFEEVRRSPLPELLLSLQREAVRGECVVVLGPGSAIQPEVAALQGESVKDVATALASRWGCKRRDVYQRLLELERELGPESS